MKKKILALFLAVVMCVTTLSVMALAANIEKIPSTIPGTDIAYNYVKNITVHIPETDVTFGLEGVSDKVGIIENEKSITYIFAFYGDVPGKVLMPSEWAPDWEEGSEDYYAKYGIAWGGFGASLYTDENGVKDWSVGRGGTWFYEPSCTITEGVDLNRSLYIEHWFLCNGNIGENFINIGNESGKEIKVYFVEGKGGEEDGFWLAEDLMSWERDEDYIDQPPESVFNNSDWKNIFIPKEIEKIDITDLAVTDGEEITENPQYSVTKGANSVWNSSSNEDLTITADGDFSKFTGIKIDNETLDPANYDAKSGSTVVTLKASYLKTLSSGKHTVTFVYTDGEVSTQLEIKGAKTTSNSQGVEIPNTGNEFGNAAAIYAIIAIMSAFGVAIIYKRKYFVK